VTDSKPLAVVNGASSGIGRELARQFATNGFDVIVAAEDSGLVSAVDDLAATGAEVRPVRADLAKRILPGMVARGAGRVLFTSSVATVTALLPGPTDTEFFERAGMEGTPVGSSDKDDPADVARDGFEALMAGKSQVVGGSAKNKVQVAAAKLLPDQARAATHAKMTKPERD
jgi:short-subunit dehydrogenase